MRTKTKTKTKRRNCTPASAMRTFDTGATRSGVGDKLCYEGFLSPLVLERYAQYMHAHRVQEDGVVREADNWQKGIPTTSYMDSKLRHLVDTWKAHRGYPGDIEESLCAELFNTMGYLHALLVAKLEEERPF